MLTFGPLRFESNLIQAPLAGISCAPFRSLVWEFGGAAYCCTEMLSAHDIATGVLREPRFLIRYPQEKFLCWQLSGNNPEHLSIASDYAISQGANILDLNCGCPQPKIRKKGCGSRLLNDEKKLGALVKAMQRDKKIPVTVKMRIDAGQKEFCDVTLAKMLEGVGVDAITVHGRHWTHDYDIPCEMDAIAKIADTVKIPVIGNGDIDNIQQLRKFLLNTQCAGFMIGRAGVGQPWIFHQLSNPSFTAPSSKIIGGLFLKHISGLIDLEGEYQAILQSRRLGKYYARQLKNNTEFLNKIYEICSFSELSDLINQFFL